MFLPRRQASYEVALEIAKQKTHHWKKKRLQNLFVGSSETTSWKN